MWAYLDLDISDARGSYKRAHEFVAATSIKYGLSSPSLSELGGRERLSVPELYANDYTWSARGPCAVDPQPCTRLVFELMPTQSPLAVENFISLCTGCKGKSKSSGVQLSYLASKVHRYIPSFILQGGDLTHGNGAGGESIYGKKFKDDAGGLKLKHDRRGVLSMGNSGKNSNSSQFFVTLGPAPACDKKHVVMGHLLYGSEVLDLIDAALAGQTLQDEVPSVPIVVTACGSWTPGVDLPQGFWAEDDPFRALSKP